MSTLIVVDYQNDFISGSLAVPGAEEILPTILKASNLCERTILTRDWHPADHVSFSDAPEYKDFSWPPHCVQNTWGAEFHPEVAAIPDAVVIDKGFVTHHEAYSGFANPSLLTFLDAQLESDLVVCGLATDYCVRHTVMDALREGFTVSVLSDGVRGVAEETTAVAISEMIENGAEFGTLRALV